MPTTHYIVKQGGRIGAASLRAQLDAMPDGAYKVTVARATSKTKAQNSYLHVLFTIAAQALNEGMGGGEQWTPERVKLYCKRAELYPVEDCLLPGGEIVQMPKDTRDLDDLEMGATIERVIHHFAEMGIVLPEPQQQTTLNLQQAA